MTPSMNSQNMLTPGKYQPSKVLLLLLIMTLFNINSLVAAPATNQAWDLQSSTDPMSDVKTISAFKEFVFDSNLIEATLSCDLSSSKDNSAVFKFAFFSSKSAALRVQQTGHMGSGRYRINFTSYLRRIGKQEAKEKNSVIQYSNEVADSLSDATILKGDLFKYKFFLTSNKPLIQFSSNASGVRDVLKSCGHLSK